MHQFDRLHNDAVRLTRATHSRYNIRAKHTNLDIRKNFFTNRVVMDWNALPENIKSTPKISIFKRLLNDHFSNH